MNINGVFYKSLSLIQKRILLEMDKRNRLAVIGGPGTGKTFIAAFAILKALEENKHCFFIVYNKNLNLYIKKLIGQHDFPEYLAKTYHAWLPQYLSSVLEGYTPERVKEQMTIESDAFLYNWPLIEAELEKVSLAKRKQYDFIFLDEAQDIPLELIRILKDATNKLMVTFDDSQKIGNDYFEAQKDRPFDRSDILTTLELVDSFFDLTENYRNTIQIETVAKLFGQYFNPNQFSLKHTTTQLKGPLPNLIKISDLNALARLVYADYTLNPQMHIGVLFPNTRIEEDTKRLFAFKEELAKQLYKSKKTLYYKLGTYNSVKDLSLPGVYLMSIQSSKGLEFDKVYIIETEKLKVDHFQQGNLMYVGCTRSKKDLTFIYTDEKVESLLQIAFDHSILFNQFNIANHQSFEEDQNFLTMVKSIENDE
jgi:superfamily I DNA/RNA helicase